LPRLPRPHVVHFRFASVGAVGTPLCHPFPVAPVPAVAAEGRAAAVLFHNGTWPDWRLGLEVLDDAARADAAPWSDSRVLAALAAAMPAREVAGIAGPAQRLAVLHAGGRVETFGHFVR